MDWWNLFRKQDATEMEVCAVKKKGHLKQMENKQRKDNYTKKIAPFVKMFNIICMMRRPHLEKEKNFASFMSLPPPNLLKEWKQGVTRWVSY